MNSILLNLHVEKRKCSSFHSKWLPVFLLASSLFLPILIAQRINGQNLQIENHPNHFILLVDASGSVARPEAKKRQFERALAENLVSKLYSKGFGEIPAYDPKQDRLTLYHFGIVTGGQQNAYSRLADYDFMTDFIHPVFERQKDVDETFLRSRIVPVQTYQYTVLSWAKQLALEKSRPAQPDEPVNRTFLIFVHDGVPNQNSLAEEVEMVNRWAKSRYEATLPIVNSINSNYVFTDGHGVKAPAWRESVNGEASDSPAFIEIYDVNSAERSKWEEEAARLRPFKSFRFQWTSESGDEPEGKLTAVLNEEIKDWLKSGDVLETETVVDEKGKSTIKPGLDVPVRFNSSLSCGGQDGFNAGIKIGIQRSDPLLGRRTVNYVFNETVVPPGPVWCQVGFWSLNVLILLLAALAAGAVFYYVYYRFYAVPVKIDIPGMIVPVKLMRAGTKDIVIPIVPQTSIEVFSLRLPDLFRQYLFCRGATISLATERGSVKWSENSRTAEIRLPYPYMHVPAYWEETPDKASPVILSYRQGKQHMEIHFS